MGNTWNFILSVLYPILMKSKTNVYAIKLKSLSGLFIVIFIALSRWGDWLCVWESFTRFKFFSSLVQIKRNQINVNIEIKRQKRAQKFIILMALSYKQRIYFQFIFPYLTISYFLFHVIVFCIYTHAIWSIAL